LNIQLCDGRHNLRNCRRLDSLIISIQIVLETIFDRQAWIAARTKRDRDAGRIAEGIRGMTLVSGSSNAAPLRTVCALLLCGVQIGRILTALDRRGTLTVSERLS
jgi:hypothetical protein